MEKYKVQEIERVFYIKLQNIFYIIYSHQTETNYPSINI